MGKIVEETPMTEQELYRFWKKYVCISLYRVDWKDNITGNYLNPKKDPYAKIMPDIKKIFVVLRKLERKGFGHTQMWDHPINATTIMRVSEQDMRNDFIDLTPKKAHIQYYKKWRGGALSMNVHKITTDILKRAKLNKTDECIVRKVHAWTGKRKQYTPIIITVLGQSVFLQTALFQHFEKYDKMKRYWASPFGNFDHFKKIARKKEFEKYLPYLKDKKTFYLRVKENIPLKQVQIR